MQAFVPMSPILVPRLPAGPEWAYQLKWDGFRMIAAVQEGRAALWSKKMRPKGAVYPDLTKALARLPGRLVLDGEAVILDPATGRPSFQQMQKRDKQQDPGAIAEAARRSPVQFVLFDLLYEQGEDLRGLPWEERNRRLQALAAGWGPPFFVADSLEDGAALWRWVEEHGWEGVIAKRRTSPYREGKEHGDWYKRKLSFRYEAQAVAVLYKEGRLSSLAMIREGRYFGRISSGLNEAAKSQLARLEMDGSAHDYFPGALPEGLRGTVIRWLRHPLAVTVTGRERTEAGLLRHPKLLELEGIPL
ncbi:ATP-dependent DNA ligase [Paenibacillus glufosinatiresistens]|uniref:ATP-dependent DNA ligase n=1 Tax=Paenibacillus glufosinatiresistens TaxID=3070657 RepID=UPI00286D6D8F|nr:DNA ligase [Paenibacillus sp. YX.27]